jgi:hypothetical protein
MPAPTPMKRPMTITDVGGGLPTMKLGFVSQGKPNVPAGAHKLSYTGRLVGLPR